MRFRDASADGMADPVLVRYRATRAWLLHLALGPALLALSVAQLAFGDTRGVMALVWIAGTTIATVWSGYALVRSRSGLEITRELIRVSMPRRRELRLADITHVALLHSTARPEWVLYVWVGIEPVEIPIICSRRPRLPRDKTAPLDVTEFADSQVAVIARAVYDAAQSAQVARRKLDARTTREFLDAENYGEAADAFWSPDGTYGRIESVAGRWSSEPNDGAIDPEGAPTPAIPTAWPAPRAMEARHARMMSAGLRRTGWTCLTVAVVGVLVSLIPSMVVDDTEHLIAHGQRTPGTVTAVHGDDLMEVGFEQDGVPRTARIVRDSDADYEVGQAITVVYDETNPARVRTTRESNPPMWVMQVGLWGMLVGASMCVLALFMLVASWRTTRRSRALRWRTCRASVQLTTDKHAYLLVRPPGYLPPVRLRVRRRGPFGPSAQPNDGVAHVVMGPGRRALVSVGGYLPVRAWVLGEAEDEVVGRLSIVSGT